MDDLEQGASQENLEDVSPSFKRGGKKPSKPKPAQKAAGDVGDKVVKKGARQLAKQAALAIGRAIAHAVSTAVAALASYFGWPVLVGALAVFLIIMIIFGGLFSTSIIGLFGKKPYDKLNQTKDKKLVTQTRAVAGEKAAQRELIADQAISAKNGLKKISTNNAEAQKIIEQINQLLDAIVALSDNPDAVGEKIKQILALLDKLKSLLPDQGDKIDDVKNLTDDVQKLIQFYQRSHLVLNPKDLEYIRNYDADRRIVQMLVYLVTPIDQGGAGHERIRVKRIKFSYDTQRKSPSKETEYSDKEEPNVSAHFTGQAADIAEIDDINCTQIKRVRIGNSKKSKLPPIPIKVAWQTEKGYLEGQGPDAYGANMHQVFNNLAAGSINNALIEQIADIVGVELDPEKLKGKNFGEITREIGLAIIKENLDIPGDYEMGNNLEDIVNNTGRAYLAQALDVPIEGIRGGSPDELMKNIGRATMEKSMSLPAGSLAGNNSAEILTSLGRRQMEESLHLSRDSLAVPFSDSESFKKALGQGRVETSLEIKPQTFYGNSTDEVKKRLGKEMFNFTFANPQTLDNWFGLISDTTEKLVSGAMSPNEYNVQVGHKVFLKELSIYQNAEKRADAYGVDSSDLQSLISGNASVFGSIGKTALARKLTPSDQEQVLIRTWLETKNLPAGLDEDYLGGQYGLKESDLSKIFIADLDRLVFQRVGKVESLNNLTENEELNPYLQPLKDIKFYLDRLELIKNYTNDLERESSDPQIRTKAAETKSLINNLSTEISIKEIRGKIKQVQENIKFIEDQALANDPDSLDKIKAIKQAIDEMIEGKELSNFESLDADSIHAKNDLHVGLSKKDVLNLATGKKTVNDLVYQIGLKKWEIELDLPKDSLKRAFDSFQKNGFEKADDTLLINIGQAKVSEYRGVKNKNPNQVDKDLNLPAGLTRDYQEGQMTDSAYYKAVGKGTSNNLAANLINKQFDLTGDPNYTLGGADVTNLLNGGWFQVALKVGGRVIDEAFDFPAGGTMDIINQHPEGGDVLGMLAEQKLGGIAGLSRAVSINGDINYNLGRVKIEQEFGLKPNEINDGNLVDFVQRYTNSNQENLELLDIGFGLNIGASRRLIESGISSHDYIVKTGEYLRNNVFYDQLARYAPALKDKDIREAVMALANQTGTPQDIVKAAGGRQIGNMLGLNYAVSIRGNFKDNLGQGKIEDRLGLKNGTFYENIGVVTDFNGVERFEAAFYLDRGSLDKARNDPDYWNGDHKNQANLVDAILNIPSGSTKDFLTGAITLAQYVDRAGKSTMTEVSVDKLVDLMQLDDKYKPAIETLVSVMSQDPSLSNPESQGKLFASLTSVGGLNLDNKTKFDPGTWQKMLFIDPNDPDRTGLNHADEIVLEQGKKYLPRWLGMEEKYEPFIDIIYEQGLKNWGPAGLYNEETMVRALQEVTHIPDENDARKFLTGDIKGGLTAWGAAQIVEAYNKEFGAGNEFKLDYATAKKAYFNDPTGEQVIGEAAVASLESETGVQLDEETAASIYQEAVRESRNQARKDLQYNAIDMQLHKKNKNIPSGFTKAMREGTSEQRWQMGLTYIGNTVHNKNPEIPAELLPELGQYFNPDSPSFHDLDALSGTTYGFLDNQMQDWFGDFVQPGTAKALFAYGQTGQLGSPNDPGSLAQIYTDYGINTIANWADKETGLPNGTTKMTYDYFTKYEKARKAHKAAQAVGDAAKIKESAAALNNFQAEAISAVLTFVFQKELAQMDENLGLVPGSSATLVSIGVGLLITGAANPAMIAYFILTNMFGVYRIDVTCSACGNYPGMGPSAISQSGNSCPLSDFDGKSESSFRTNSVLAAQYKVNQLIGDILNMSSVLKNKELIPTQIMTLRQEDIDSYAGKLKELYGSDTFGNMGMWANETTWNYIHIGY